MHTCALTACADLEIFVKGGPGQTARKKHEQRFFLVLSLFYSFQEGIQWFYDRENYVFPRIQRGPTVSRGGPAASWGVQMFFYRTPYNLSFLRGGGPDPLSPPSGFAHEQRGSNTDRNRSLNMLTD